MIGRTPAPTLAVLQTAEAQGGHPLVVAAVLFVLAVSFLLSLAIAWRLYVGYRGSGDRSMLALAVGLVLLTTVPTAIRVVVPTALGGQATLRIVAASASQLVGLVVILLAIRTPARRRRRVRHRGAPLVLPPIVAQVGLQRAVARLGLLAPGATAALGAYVSWQAYRGYRRNDSAPMGWLAAGIALLTVAPFVLMVALVVVLRVSDATGLLAMSLAQLAGLLSVLYSLVRS